MVYVEVLKKRYNNVGRTFCDAINKAYIQSNTPRRNFDDRKDCFS